ncbi:hypothetical protein QYF61_013614 [Mycteria americana]|uniref:Rna-directed dna polymerase from mobile element jockey-like n=1 Tax=Mycteria americana TaxID=33587 RepID=A0AAN7Q2X7_MYCAM|nr:hypothetical protein QYF61_013614 [Mycteria americana]
MGWNEEDGARPFSGCPLKGQKAMGGQKLEQVDQSGCAVSILGDTENVPGHSPGQPAPAAPALSCATIQTDLSRLEKWAGRNLMKFNQRKCKGLHLGRNNPRHQYTLGWGGVGQVMGWKAAWQRSSWGPAGQKAEHEPAMCPWANNQVGCIGNSIASSSGEVILPLHSVLSRHSWSARFTSGLPVPDR